MHFGGKSRFPIINSPEEDKKNLLFFLEKQLKYERAYRVVRKGDVVTFSGGMFFFLRPRTFLELGGRGFVRVVMDGENLVVIYRQSFIGIFLLYLAGGLFLLFLMGNGSNTETSSVIAILLIILLATGFNVFIRLVSLAMFIERTFDAFMKK